MPTYDEGAWEMYESPEESSGSWPGGADALWVCKPGRSFRDDCSYGCRPWATVIIWGGGVEDGDGGVGADMLGGSRVVVAAAVVVTAAVAAAVEAATVD